jgi:hypothetical protein
MGDRLGTLRVVDLFAPFFNEFLILTVFMMFKKSRKFHKN